MTYSLITSVTVSAASTVQIDNCFSTAYTHYGLTHQATGTTNNTYFRTRFRSGGVSESGSVYQRQGFFADNTTLSGFRNLDQDYALRVARCGTTDATIQFPPGLFLQISNPYKSVYTTMRGSYPESFNTSLPNIIDANVVVENTTLYDGIEFFPEAGTITGTVYIYGLREA